MYVQEYGSECRVPNQRCVYISYLDSVKYFDSKVEIVGGNAINSLVYQEILIGYLEYCKKQGFTSCYIWACPPFKDEDFILHCLPDSQREPKSDMLRQWYIGMLHKAMGKDIVMDYTNLYDRFFVSDVECKTKVTAAMLPYFDGNYWPSLLEDLIRKMCQEEEDGKRQNKKGKTKETTVESVLTVSDQSDPSTNASKDTLFMQKLGEIICGIKEEFIVVHLQHPCSHCRIPISSRFYWSCNVCNKFNLCSGCYLSELKLGEKERHPIDKSTAHVFTKQAATVSLDTNDGDEVLESEFFDTRQAFLRLCQGNHYQYDTLRRAKHSSMMILYHLHNPTAPAFVRTCNICHVDVKTGQGWQCEVCPDYDVCSDCHHQHQLTNYSSIAHCNAQNNEAKPNNVSQLKNLLDRLVHDNMLDVLVHAPKCNCQSCKLASCSNLRQLFRHWKQCQIHATGGCGQCKTMWNILRLHARDCKTFECYVPFCRDLKEDLRRLQEQSHLRRKAVVMKMME